ncbi:MAG: DUF2628 domain-containing protein [Alphaproteobacteria bacterium]|nr:DUF2628 domain-containing protein [Alphaproteobacteria bacterium]
MTNSETEMLGSRRIGPTGHAEQDCVSEQELRRFIAIRPESYLRHFSATGGCFDARSIAKRRLTPSWHWPAFLVTVPWMFYRKMYSGGIILVALPVLFEHILPGALFLGSGIVIAVAAGLFAKSWYIDHAVKRIHRAKQELSTEESRQAFVVRAGGASVAGALFGLLIQGVTIAVIILGLLPPTLL